MTEPSHPYEILDVFTDTPLQGNPLAVFTEGEQIPSRLMQAVGRELNLSETVFVLPGDDECDAQIRIFTPAAELPFAGHPTLGAAFVVGERDDLETVRLRLPAGLVPVTLSRRQDEIVFGEMDQPIPVVEPFPEPDAGALLEALGIETAPALPVEAYTNGPVHVMVALDTLEQVASLAPDITAVARLGPYNVSCFAHEGPTVKTRMFAPGIGVAEDPATGSAAGPLALHLARHGRVDAGQTVVITQGVEINRPSVLHAQIDGDPSAPQRIRVGGSAVRVATGHFRLQ